MAATTAIEWTDKTWNPIVGCSVVSPGCTNCYAMTMAARIERMEAGRTHYAGTTKPSKAGPVWTGKLALAPKHILTQPLRWKKPDRIFVNSMGDLFHDDVPDAWIDKVFAVMALAPQHTFQVLTKRAERMREYVDRLDDEQRRWERIGDAAVPFAGYGGYDAMLKRPWPLPNLWLGVSAEDQARADERIPHLLATPAAIRFVSAEPLLGPLDMTAINHPERAGWLCPLTGCHELQPVHSDHSGAHIDWVIAGGESGRNARPAHPDWFRSLRNQCAAAGVPFFFKQWGEWYPALDRDVEDPDWRRNYSTDYVNRGRLKWLNLAGGCGFHGERFHVMRRVGKKAAGNLLDGRQHLEFPPHGSPLEAGMTEEEKAADLEPLRRAR